MPTLRRYLRISKYTVLECRITTSAPSDVPWLELHLPVVFSDIRYLVRPKLEASRDLRGKKGKAEKDVVETEDYTVAVYITKVGRYHSILARHRDYSTTAAAPLKSNSAKLLGEGAAPVMVREESSDSEPELSTIPAAGPEKSPGAPRQQPTNAVGADVETEEEEEEGDEKKKLSFTTSYEGFDVSDRILQLVVERRHTAPPEHTAQIIENWIAQSQVARDSDGED